MHGSHTQEKTMEFTWIDKKQAMTPEFCRLHATAVKVKSGLTCY